MSKSKTRSTPAKSAALASSGSQAELLVQRIKALGGGSALSLSKAGLASPVRGNAVTWASTVQSPGDSGLFSPSFTLSSPFGELPLSCGSALFSPSIFDANPQTNLTCEVESDFFDTFQITSIASNISTIISLSTEDAQPDEDLESGVECILSLKEAKGAQLFDEERKRELEPVRISLRTASKQLPSLSVIKQAERVYSAAAFTSPMPSSKPKVRSKKTPPEGSVQCKCKKSACLKLYCDCFASSMYCRDACKCVDCLNSKDSESRQDAIKQISERKPTIFKENYTPKAAACLSGCHCKKSRCLKKYCVCYEGRTACTETCKCVSCQNKQAPDSAFTDRSSDSSIATELVARKVRFTSAGAADADTSIESISIEPDSSRRYMSALSTIFSADSSFASDSPLVPLKKRRTEAPPSPVYPFFSESVKFSKLTALRIMEFLDNKDLFAVSLASSLLNSAANDEALWE